MKKILFFLAVINIIQFSQAQLSITVPGATNLIDFQNTVPGVNNGFYRGLGFTNAPLAGQLDSDAWASTGWDIGNSVFGGNYTTNDFARGFASAPVGTGGFYGYTNGITNFFLIQPGGGDWEPGTLTLRIQNNTGNTITNLDVSYQIAVRNDQARGNSFNFSYSSNDIAYASVAALNYTSTVAADALGIIFVPRSTAISGVTLGNGEFFYLRWSGAAAGGAGSRDEFGLDNITVVAATTASLDITAPVVNTLTPADGAVGVGINDNLVISFNENVQTNAGNITIVETGVGNFEVIPMGDGRVSVAGSTLTINPAGIFANSTNYNVLIDAGAIEDLSGNDFAGFGLASDWNFTTAAAADVIAPLITSLSPLDDAVNVDSNTNLVVQFNENVAAGAGNIRIVEETGGGDIEVEVIPATNANVTIVNNTVTIDPALTLAFSTYYHVLIDSGAFRDGSSNSFAGINNPTTWNFRTVSELGIDNTGNPVASNLNQGATNQPIYGFRLTLSEGDVDFTGVVINRTLGNGAILGNVSNYRLYYDNDNNGFDAGDLLLATVPGDNTVLNFTGIAGQTVQVGTPRRYVVVADVATNALDNGTISLQIVNNTNISTSTVLITSTAPYPNTPINHILQEVTPPTITLLSPLDGATNVATTANLVVQFSENVQTNAGNITIVETGIGNFEVITLPDTRVTVSGNSVTIDPFGTLANSGNYHVLIEAGAIEDLAGNDFAGFALDTDWNFATAAAVDVTAPTVTTLTPADGAVGVGVNDNLVIQFNENVQTNSGTITIVDSLAGTNFEVIAVGDPRVAIVGNTVTINPNGSLLDGTIYNILIDSGAIEDLAGNSFAGFGLSTDWDFTTAVPADVTAPAVTTLTPADGAVGVGVNDNLVIQFNENVQTNSGNITIVETGVGNFEVIPMGDGRISVAGNTVTINPVGSLAFNTAYHVLIDDGAIQDVAGNGFAGIINDTTWNFQTIATQLSIDNAGNPVASNLNQGATNQPLYGFRLTATNGAVDFTAVNITRTLGNGALVNNVSNYRLFFDNDDNGFDTGDNLLATVPADNATINFGGLGGQTVQVGIPRRYVVVADVSTNAVDNGTINLQVVNNGDFTTTANTISSTAPYPNSAIIHTFRDIIYLQDSFPNDGNLTGQVPVIGGVWTTISGANPLQVIGGRVQITTNTASAEDVASSFAWPGGGSIFAGFTLRMVTAPSAAGDFMASFRSSGNYNGRIFALRPGPAGTFRLGLSHTTTSSLTNWLTDLATNQDYRVVVRLTENGINDNLTLWINPTNITDTSVSTITASFSTTNSSGFAFRQNGTAHGASAIDDLIIDDNFAAVAGRIIAVDNTNNPVASNLSQGAVDQPIYGFRLSANNQAINFNSVNLARTLDNGAILGNFSNYRLYYDSNTNGFDVGDILLATVPADNSTINFGGIGGQTVQVGTPRRYVVVADVATNAVTGGTIGLQIVNNTNVGVNAGVVFVTSGAYPNVIVNHTVPDLASPTITTLTPADGAVGVGVNDNLVIQFNENVQTNAGNITIVETGVGNFEVIPMGDGRVSIVGNTVTIDPFGTLANSGNYHVLIEAGAIEDLAGNDFAGFALDTDWNFATAAAVDVTAPTVTTLTPADGAVGVGVNDNLVIQFNENVQTNSGTITIVDSLAGTNFEVIAVGDARVVVVGNTVTINPNGSLLDGTIYNILIDSGAIEDLAGNSFAGFGLSTDWDFTTAVPADVTAPAVTTLTPADGAVGVGVNDNLVIQFNENVQTNSGNITIVETGGGNFEVIPVGDARVSIVGNTVTINPTGTFANSTNYHVLIEAEAIEDLSGNDFAGFSLATDWNFETAAAADVTAPVVTTLTPADGAVGVGVNDNLVIQFNENVQTNTGTITILDTIAGTNFEVIAMGDARVSIVDNTLTINPAGTLEFNRDYHVLIANGAILDGSSNIFAGISNQTNWNFQTELLELNVDNTGNPIASSLNQGVTNQPIYGFQLSATNGNVNFNGVNITRTFGNGALTNNVNNYRLFFDNDDNGFDEGDILLATVPTDSATINFAGIVGQTVQIGTPRRYVVVADVATNVVINGTISLQIANNASISTSADAITSTAPYPNVAVEHTFQDATAPVITSLNPNDDSANVDVNVDLVAQFSENVLAGAGNITIVETDAAANFEVIPVGDGRVSIVGNTLTINPNGTLASGTNYHVLIANGAILDGSSNTFAGINNATTWNFTTLAAAVVNTAPTVEGAGLADVEVEENAPATIINLPPAFQDAETTDANLVYSVTAINFVDGDAEIFSNVAVDNAVDTLTLNYLPNSNGVYNVTVRATDAGGLFVEDTFQVTVLVEVTPAVDTNSITSLVVTPTNGVALVGKTLQMTATGVATNGTTNLTLVSSWSSADTNVATVDNAGVVTGVTPGDALISAVFNSITNSVTVKARKEFAVTFSKIKPAKRTTKLKAGKGFTVKGAFDTGTNLFTTPDITSRPLKIQLAFLTSVTNTNGVVTSMTAFQDVTKIKGFKAIKPKSKGKFIAKAVGTDLAAGNATVLLQATLGPEGTNQEVSAIFANPTSFQVRRK